MQVPSFKLWFLTISKLQYAMLEEAEKGRHHPLQPLLPSTSWSPAETMAMKRLRHHPSASTARPPLKGG